MTLLNISALGGEGCICLGATVPSAQVGVCVCVCMCVYNYVCVCFVYNVHTCVYIMSS